MFRTSVALRFRKATMTPSDVCAADVEQHSQTRDFTTVSLSCLPSWLYRDARRLISPVSFSGSVARPSIHTTPNPAPEVGNREAKPCSVSVPSWWGLTGFDQV